MSTSSLFAIDEYCIYGPYTDGNKHSFNHFYYRSGSTYQYAAYFLAIGY
jgi:hypothetical protein